MPITKSDLGVVIARSHLYLLLPNKIPGGRGRWVIVDFWGERVKTVEEWEGMETIKPVDNWVPPRYLCFCLSRKEGVEGDGLLLNKRVVDKYRGAVRILYINIIIISRWVIGQC